MYVWFGSDWRRGRTDGDTWREADFRRSRDVGNTSTYLGSSDGGLSGYTEIDDIN